MREIMRRQKASILIQSMHRLNSARISYIMTIANVILCQSVSRQWIAKSRVREILSDRREQAATKLQAAHRGYYQRMDYIVTVSSVIICQSVVRRKIASRQADSLRMIQCSVRQSAAISIQRVTRGYFTRFDYTVALMKIIISQSAVRRWRDKKNFKELLDTKHTAAAVVIQKRFRGYTAFTKYIETVVNIIICQAVARKFIALKIAQTLRDAKESETRIKSATKIAATYKCHAAYSSYTATLTDIILCQAYVRRLISSRETAKKRRSWHDASVQIQSVYRGYIQSVRFIFTLSRIIMLQSQVRGHLARNAVEHKKLIQHAAAIAIQKNWRSFKVETDFM